MTTRTDSQTTIASDQDNNCHYYYSYTNVEDKLKIKQIRATDSSNPECLDNPELR